MLSFMKKWRLLIRLYVVITTTCNYWIAVDGAFILPHTSSTYPSELCSSLLTQRIITLDYIRTNTCKLQSAAPNSFNNSNTTCSSIDSTTNDHKSNTKVITPKNTKTYNDKPHEQRVKQQRKARRLNHSFMHLYRHDNPLFDDQKIAPSSKAMSCAKTYLLEYGNSVNMNLTEEMINQMSQDFPPLLELDVKRHLRPKLRFLKYTLGYCNSVAEDTSSSSVSSQKTLTLSSIPPQYFGARLEKVIAPRHAFLMSRGLPHGKLLLENDALLFKEFLYSCRRLKSFCALCNQWKEKYGLNNYHDEHYLEIDSPKEKYVDNRYGDDLGLITAQEIEAFDALFSRYDFVL